MEPKDEIKQKVEIAELVGEYVQLKPSGSGLKGLCPFHSEKSPSFHVSPDKQIWHCFGCNEGGDCFSFLMKMEGMDFPEALRYLGDKVGVEVKRFSSAKHNLQTRLSAMNELAAKYYHKVLTDSPQAEKARAYLAERAIPSELIERFGLGFAPDGWDALSQFLQKRGYSGSEGMEAGLQLRSKKGTGMIDRFRARIMVPLRDQHGNTVGFTGRVLPGDDYPAKYMNSPETPIYHKGRILFGLDVAKRAIKDAGKVIIVEGNLDVVASHKAGVENVVASSGTALTEDQLALLKRYTSTAVFSFDQDAAGFAAARKGITLARKLGFDVRVAVISEEIGKDPDEVVQKDPSLWREVTEKTLPIMQYYIDRATAGKDLSKVEDKREVGRFLLPELARIEDVVEREHWLAVIADLLHIEPAVLRSSIQPQKASKQAGKPQAAAKPPERETPESQAGSLMLGAFLQSEEARKFLKEYLDPDILAEDRQKLLYKEALMMYDSDQSSHFGHKSFFGRLRNHLETKAEDLIPLLDQVALRGEQWIAELPPPQVRKQLELLLRRLEDAGKDAKRKSLEAQIRQAERAGDTDLVTQLIREFHELR